MEPTRAGMIGLNQRLKSKKLFEPSEECRRRPFFEGNRSIFVSLRDNRLEKVLDGLFGLFLSRKLLLMRLALLSIICLTYFQAEMESFCLTASMKGSPVSIRPWSFAAASLWMSDGDIFSVEEKPHRPKAASKTILWSTRTGRKIGC